MRERRERQIAIQNTNMYFFRQKVAEQERLLREQVLAKELEADLRVKEMEQRMKEMEKKLTNELAAQKVKLVCVV